MVDLYKRLKIMEKREDLKFLYSGTEINVSVLQQILEENNIASLIRNDMQLGMAAGFGGGLSGFAAKLYVTEEDFDAAQAILEEFKNSIDEE